MTLRELIDETVATLDQAGMDQPSFEARQLVQEALDVTFAQIVSQPERAVDQATIAKIRDWGRARAEGQPLAYLSRRRGFYKNDFQVEPGVLVPRPETELVVETVLRRIDEADLKVDAVADLGCGSGCIGISLLTELSAARLFAVDVGEVAVRVTKRNAESLGVAERTTVERTRVDQWRPLHKFDVIVANPPYIAENDARVEPGVRMFEPHEALFSGEDGLEALREWSAWAWRHLEPGGLFVGEFGAGQSRPVQDILNKLGFAQVQVERDLAGIDRVISAFRTR